MLYLIIIIKKIDATEGHKESKGIKKEIKDTLNYHHHML